MNRAYGASDQSWTHPPPGRGTPAQRSKPGQQPLHILPKYLQLAHDLRESITSGEFAVGELMPTETDLCNHYGVSRITVRAAIKELAVQGIVAKRPGIGTRVLRKDGAQRFVHSCDSLESALQFTQETRFELLDSGVLPETDPSLHRPDFPSTLERLWIRGLRWGKEEPICLSDFYMPTIYRNMVNALPDYVGSLGTLLYKLSGVKVVEMEQHISAVAVDSRQAKLLRVTRRSPALITRRWHRTAQGEIVIASVSVYPSDRYSYHILLRESLAQ